MTFKYTVEARDTMYAGCLFRSRLEATWAAFFDICGVQWVYEPFDLPGWSPDFLINHVMLCEVKPFVIPDDDLQLKVSRASRTSVLFLGPSPLDQHTLGYVIEPCLQYEIVDCEVYENVDSDPDPEIGEVIVRSSGIMQWSTDSVQTETVPVFSLPVPDLIRAFNEAKNKVRFTVR